MSAQKINNVHVFDSGDLIREGVKSAVAKMKSAVVFYYPHEDMLFPEVLKAVDLNEVDVELTDNRIVILDTSKFSHDELSILSYNISRLGVSKLATVFENGREIDYKLFKRKTQPIPFDESSIIKISDADFEKLIDELNKPKSPTEALKKARKNYLKTKTN